MSNPPCLARIDGLMKNKANDCGTHISYRVPKSALNALSISVAIELKAAKENIAVLCVDPGDVPTKLSRWAGDIDLNDYVRGMYDQIEKATMEDTGLFVNWRGHKWPYRRPQQARRLLVQLSMPIE